MAERPRVAVLYHYFHPDDVVSARHFAEFCLELAERGWEVEALPSNRGCRDESRAYPLEEQWRGITIRRVWRPPLRQASTLGRVVNAGWMLAAWCGLVFRGRRRRPDVLVVGTDPILSVLVAAVVRRFRPGIGIAHWCYDVYPEAMVAEGIFPEDGAVVRVLKALVRRAYASCDLVADLGRCMRDRLEAYGSPCRKLTLVPWALAEPDGVSVPDPEARRELFGDSALGLLYSGNFGRAHAFAEFLELARRLRGESVHFCFGVRGNRAEQLRQAIGPDDTNVSIAGFAPEATLLKRLEAADVHLVSLRPEWTGLVVPSKFFGSLAAGRPVVFLGSRDAAIAGWIREHRVGWVLDRDSLDEVAADLRRLSTAPEELAALQRRCHQVYREHFSRRRVMDDWHAALQEVVAARRGPDTPPPEVALTRSPADAQRALR